MSGKASEEAENVSITTKRRMARQISYVPVEEIVPGPLQPRQYFPREGLEELRDSIAQHGVLQPLTVRAKGERFELIAGERRLRAARMAGFDPDMGARPLRRALRETVEDPLAELLLRGDLRSGDTAEVTARDGKIALDKTSA